MSLSAEALGGEGSREKAAPPSQGISGKSASLVLRASPVNWEQNVELLERKGVCG